MYIKEFSNDTKLIPSCENNKNPEYNINIGIKNPIIVFSIKSFLIADFSYFFFIYTFVRF